MGWQSGELQHPRLPPSWCPGITGGDTGPKSRREAFWVCQPCAPSLSGLRRAWRGGFASARVRAGRLRVALSHPSGPLLGQAPPSSTWKPGQRPPSPAEAPADAGPACPSHCQVFTCSVCRETFRRRMELRVHMVSHTGEMPYKVSLGLPLGPRPWGPSHPALYVGWCQAPSPCQPQGALPSLPVSCTLASGKAPGLSGPLLLSVEAVARGPPPRVLRIRTGSLLASQAGPCPQVPPVAQG